MDGKLNRREWEMIHHKLCFGISVAMISLIKVSWKMGNRLKSGKPNLLWEKIARPQ